MQLLKISVVVTAYNHEKYIAQCLDSILQQKGDFVLEVILGDDCSKDNTRQIMQTYTDKHSGIFRILPSTTNLGVTMNIQRCLDACSGDYIAFCEGDDYWTDSHKLIKQVEFLEAYPECSLCFNAIILFYEDGNKYVVHSQQMRLTKDTITTEDLIDTNYIGNFSCCMYRADVIKKIPASIYDIFVVDWMFNITCSRLGKVGFIRDWMSVYRIHAEGAWGGKSQLDQYDDLCRAIDSYNKFFSYEYDGQFSKLKEKVQQQYRVSSKNQDKQAYGKTNIMQKCWALLIRAIRNPKAACDKLREIIINIE
jgi:glycosyltransferase involved in cell wall biosynthesis